MRTVQSWSCELGSGADTMFHRTYFLLEDDFLQCSVGLRAESVKRESLLRQLNAEKSQFSRVLNDE